jgi:hypothetical protein
VRLPDVNILVYAFRKDTADHASYRSWLLNALNGDESLAIADLVLSGFLRVVTHPRVFREPSSLDAALSFVAAVRDAPNVTALAPGARHWDIFTRLCRDSGVKGNLVPDAYLAAMAIEHGATFVSTDRDFARFSGLRWLYPFATS